MELIPFDKIATLALFMGALGGLWLLVQRHRGRLSAPLQRGRRLRVREVASLGPVGRALILSVDGGDYLVVQVKGSGLALQPLPPMAEGAA